MPAAISNQIFYLSANKPTGDGTTSGGAIDKNTRLLTVQLTATATVGFKSSNAGDTTQTVTISGRDTNGVIIGQTITLNGTTEVDTAQVYSLIESVTLSAVLLGTLTVLQGAGGTSIGQTVPVGELGFAILFQRASGQSTPVARYEKLFMFDNDALALNAPVAIISTDSTGYYGIGPTLAQDDATTVANRVTVPVGISFVGDGASVVGPATVASGHQWGLWIRQSLPANPTTGAPTFTLQVQYS